MFTLGVFSIRYSVFGVQYSVFGIRCSVFGIQYSVFSIQYSVFGVFVCSPLLPPAGDIATYEKSQHGHRVFFHLRSVVSLNFVQK